MNVPKTLVVQDEYDDQMKLSAAEQEHLLTEFAALETGSYGQGKIQQFITDIEGLETVYGRGEE